MRRLLFLLLLPVLAALGGCAVYPAAPVYSPGVYAAPRPYGYGYGYRPYGYGYGYRPYGYGYGHGWRRW